MILTLEIDDELLNEYEEAFGTDNVYIHNMEESAEYIQAVSHVYRGKSNGDSVIEEMADTLICMMHLLRILDRADDLKAMFHAKQGKALRQLEASR